MGVNRSDYILIGYEVSANLKDYDENYLDEVRDQYYYKDLGKGDFVLLEDNYSEQYAYFGIILGCDKEGCDGLQPFEYDVNKYTEEVNEVKNAANEEFGIHNSYEPNLIVLTYWH